MDIGLAEHRTLGLVRIAAACRQLELRHELPLNLSEDGEGVAVRAAVLAHGERAGGRIRGRAVDQVAASRRARDEDVLQEAQLGRLVVEAGHEVDREVLGRLGPKLGRIGLVGSVRPGVGAAVGVRGRVRLEQEPGVELLIAVDPVERHVFGLVVHDPGEGGRLVVVVEAALLLGQERIALHQSSGQVLPIALPVLAALIAGI
jgi:hypothetical protein